MKKGKPYPLQEEENGSCMTAHEPANAACAYETAPFPNDVAYAHVVNGVLQVTPDMEEEIAEVERGEVVSMDEFKTMFSQWLD